MARAALEDLAYERFAQTEIARLEERASRASRVEAKLALGGHAEVVGELEGPSPTTRTARACGRS